MQTSELDQKNNKDTGDVESINFRPSPNFKHMKKYLKASPNQSSDPSTSPPNEEQEQMNSESETSQASTSSMAQPGQPPLPPNSPPPDLVVPKQEVEDEEYNDRGTQRPEPKVEDGVVKTEKTPEKTMCRQFARGTCTRGSSCIYVHELILSQLPGVYTFCKNFQNSICKFPMCKFVHATVFEKEHFYRTGKLPPQSLAHLKESNSALAPPSAPVDAHTAESKEFMNPPPTMHPGVSALPMSGTSPPDDLAMSEILGPSPRPFHIDNAAQPEAGIRQDGCPNCDMTERRLILAKELYDTAIQNKAAQRLQKIKDEEKAIRMNKLMTYIVRNKSRGDGSPRDMDALVAEFILKEGSRNSRKFK